MALNIGGNLSDDDRDRVRNIKNPPAFEAGDDFGMFDSGGSGGGDIFDSLDDIFGDSSSGSSWGDLGSPSESNNNDWLNPTNTNNANTWGNGNNNNTWGNGFNNQNQQQNQQVPTKDNFDKAIDFSTDGLMTLGRILIELLKSIKNRTADDFGYYSTNLMRTGFLGLGISIGLVIVAWLAKVGFLGLKGIGGTSILSMGLTAGTGMICLGIAAIQISSADRDSAPAVQSLPDTGESFQDDATDDYEDELGDIMEDLFGSPDSDELEIEDSGGDMFDDFSNSGSNPMDDIAIPDFGDKELEKIDFKQELDTIGENRVITRKLLVDTWLNFLPLNNPDFAVKKRLDEDSSEFQDLETVCLKAMATVLKMEMEEVKSSLKSAYETFYSYELRMKRVKGLTKTADLAYEIENYLKERPNDTSVNATIDIVGDDYYIVVTKGVKAVVTMGDCFKQETVKSFFLDIKNHLPMITGITELGEVIIDNAKNFDTMLIAGKPRSGKSWYVLSILLSLMMFNSPEDVQFIIVDPKESNLFNTLALMPHVAGLHNDEQILQLMDDIITNEAPRRKKLLSDHKVDDIWGLRKKGVKVPILYLVMDEYITIRTNLGELSKQLDSKMQVMISQLPSLGIRLIFVPHRSTGIVDKTNRTMLQFTCAIRADIDEINETLGIKGWKRPLTNPGDIAIKTSSNPEATFVRGAAITTSDEENAELIETIAKAFYKMGVDLPDMSSLELAANRDENKIREELGQSSRVQYNADNVFDNDEFLNDWNNM